MVLGQILKVGSVLIKHRKTIYAVLTAQDRYISKSFKYGGYGKATSYGVRSGALIGSVAGAFISNAEDTPGNAIQKTFTKSPSGKSYQTRNRFAKRNYSRYRNKCKPYNKYRYTNNRRY